MSKPKVTQGPWSVDGDDEEVFVLGPPDVGRRTLFSVGAQGAPEVLEIAFVVAAAPDMLNALRAYVCGYCQSGPDTDHPRCSRRPACLAVAKAEGRDES